MPSSHADPVGAPAAVTQLLASWRAGEDAARDRLIPLLYGELHRLAERSLRGERRNHTLQPTALVNEAYLRLVGVDVPWEDRAHFLAVAARVMRRILVDHARARKRNKRGAGQVHVTLDESVALTPEPSADIVALDAALDRLASHDERKARAVELHYFAGLRHDEVARILEISTATVDRDLRLAKAWLHTQIS